MAIVITGDLDRDSLNKYVIHNVIRPGYTLHIGSKCNDGRPITESWRYKQALKLGLPIIRKTLTIANDKMFVDKYSPKNICDVIGHKEQIKQITTWLQCWDNGYPEKHGILISGPPGIGKTTTVHLIAQSLGYKVTEYNASDNRSTSKLRGIISLGIKRLINDIIVMDEIDGISERGGIGELADIIKKTHTPIICITNEKPPKLKPIINVCVDIKFNRPVKSMIASSLFKIAAAENINISKVDLEGLCEQNGNDIRSVLNNLEFYGKNITHKNKDSSLRLDLFSATRQLIGNTKISLEDSTNLVCVDYNMIPLLVQESYITSSNNSSNSLNDIVHASEYLSFCDTIDKRIHTTHDWTLLPHFISNVVAAARTVSGPAPFQLFPRWLGKNSSRLKKQRLIGDIASKMGCSSDSMRLDYADSLYNNILFPLKAITDINKIDIKTVINKMDSVKLTRDDLFETLDDIVLEKIEIHSKVKAVLTREYNKIHSSKLTKKRKIDAIEFDCDNDIEDLEKEVSTINLNE